jgi:hypothetical protein
MFLWREINIPKHFEEVHTVFSFLFLDSKVSKCTPQIIPTATSMTLAVSQDNDCCVVTYTRTAYIHCYSCQGQTFGNTQQLAQHDFKRRSYVKELIYFDPPLLRLHHIHTALLFEKLYSKKRRRKRRKHGCLQ